MARRHGATDTEINEVVMVSMTVGAHKIRLMAEQGQLAVGKVHAPESTAVKETPGIT